MSRLIPPAVTKRAQDIKDLLDDLVRLQLSSDTTDEMSSQIKRKIDALVRSVRRLPR